MKLKNISKKIVHVGMNALLPDDSIPTTPAVVHLSAIQCLIAKNVLQVVEDPKPVEEPKAPDAPAAPDAPKAPEAPAAPEKPKRAKKEPETNPAE